jgi:alkylation response protein AidB-like acyl-CoA dehydrogenase
MSHAYEAPLAWIRLAIEQAAQDTGLHTTPQWNEARGETADMILEEAARFASEVISPLNPAGDRTPSRIVDDGVQTPPGYVQAYRQFHEAGWPGLSAPSEYGGQALPMLLTGATTEMWASASLAFAMCPEVSVAAIEAIRAHGSPELRDLYLPRLSSGEWTASMCMTEPQAGSDLSTIRTRAERDGDAWRLFGRKIYISWGEHDLSENIVHLVLARTPNAAPGVKGLSLFLMPKMVRDANGALVRNDVHAVSLEHKMGIRGSPTCVLAIGDREGARAWLIGAEGAGLACMFTMMNHMRLGVALHSTGVAERALQLARHHAHERRQGRGADGNQQLIVHYPDIKRMLLSMKAQTHAARCLAYNAAATLDMASLAADEETRSAASARISLLTPLAKAMCSEIALEVASLGVQVHGGAGFVDDSEISQIFRDSRIGSIFEGTNYIQAQDLLTRKVAADSGRALYSLLDEMQRAAGAIPQIESLAPLRAGLVIGIERLRAACVCAFIDNSIRLMSG